MIFDPNGNLVTSLSLAAAPDTDNAFTLLIECRAGYQLSAAVFLDGVPSTDIVLFGKANPGDSFADLSTSPIDLTPYAGTTRTFYFDCSIEPDAEAETYQTQLIVSP